MNNLAITGKHNKYRKDEIRLCDSHGLSYERMKIRISGNKNFRTLQPE